MTRSVAAGFASLLLSLPPPAIAAVVDSAPGGFTLRLEAVTAAAPGRTWDSLLRIGEWWSGAHTYSGRAANMTLELRAGGCFCERWPGGEIEHMRVALAWPEKRQLVMSGGLGPLLWKGASGALAIRISPEGQGSRITWEYRVSGYDPAGLDKLAPVVDRVLGEQLAGLAAHAARD
ncbi:MAG: ATPase [Gammaproteobacteria bacterium]|nr:ATPase [Gammaproteobacteria bacterium]